MQISWSWTSPFAGIEFDTKMNPRTHQTRQRIVIYSKNSDFSGARPHIFYFSSHSKKRVQENYSQARELIQLLLSELLDVPKRRWTSHDAPGCLPDILVDSNVISEKIRFLMVSKKYLGVKIGYGNFMNLEHSFCRNRV